MFVKRGYYADGGTLRAMDKESALVDPVVAERFEKFAQKIRDIAPKSDDFLYFTIIFLKSAEAALIDDKGEPRKIGSDPAWGYFDDNYKWHGNVKCHKNNNGDIFPESELKKHAKDWIGMPLCVDHQSSSVDGVRGIILDTHYDERLKQVVGLCALDRINYPDLARKVETGVIRYGSMGTGVETSICFDCGNKAATQKDYCKCSRYGEINVGLKPIEYSLVVQPAEPGATLLRCIASLKTYQDEFINYGVDNVDEMFGKLSESQAQHLEQIMKTACGKDGCSIPQRRKIVTSFLKENDIIKNAAQEVDKFSIALKSIQEATGDTVKDALAQGRTSASFSAYKAIYDAYGIPMSSQPQGETLSSYENAQGGGSLDLKDNGDVRDTGTASSPMVGGVVPDHPTNPFGGDGDTKGVGPESYAYAAKSMNNKIREASDFYFRSIMEDYMNEDQLRRRAEARRKVAYHQGGAAPAVEPKTYKDQGKDQVKIRNTEDKQMKQDFGPHDAATGILKEDKSVKEQLKRAELDDKRQRRIAYLQGGAAPAAEPKTYKDQGKEQVKIRNTEDKQMKQDFGPHDPATGVLKEDKSVKEQQKRAAYEGPALKTRFSKVRDLNGGIDKKASTFEVFSGDEKVISATAGDIFGDHLDQEMAEDPETTHWDWVSSQEYGKAVVATIREKGVGHVKGLLAKKAQALPDVMAPEMPPEMPAEPAPEAMPEEAPMEMGGDIESALMKAEEAIEEIRELTATEVPGTEGEGVELEPEKLALSRMVFKQLKSAQQDLSAAADELAMAAATCDVAGTLPAEQRSALSGIVTEAISDAAELRGEATALIGIAKVMLRSMVKTAEYVEVAPVAPAAVTAPVATPVEDDSLMLETLAFRKDRRARWASELLKKQATEMERPYTDEASDACGEGMPVIMLEMEGEEHEHEHEEKKEDDAEDCADCEDAASDGAVAPSASPAAAVAVSSAADTALKVETKKEEDKASDPAEALADATVKAKLSDTFMAKKAGEEREAYRYKLRRAYDVALDMQRKGLVTGTKPALDRQVDEIIQFDDKAFEAFKRAIDNTQAVQSIKIATDLGGLNVGVGIEERTVEMPKVAAGIKDLSKLWDR